jgi:hydroxymethylpyrimidine/phosphomethylpyrimidine kinase
MIKADLPVAMTIAGSDSIAGAGIQADLKAFAAVGVYGTSAITAITAQNTVGVKSFERVSPELISGQIRTICEDVSVQAAKTGMLVDEEIIGVVARAIRECNVTNLIVDTVMVSKSGHHLLATSATQAMVKELFPLAALITPNIPEAEVLTGRQISNREQMRDAARMLRDLGAQNVLIKGGHLHSDKATDILFDGRDFTEFSEERIKTRATHGTGCTLSAAIAAHVARGETLLEACRLAKAYLTGALRHSIPLGHGNGPVNHFWAFESIAGKDR